MSITYSSTIHISLPIRLGRGEVDGGGGGEGGEEGVGWNVNGDAETDAWNDSAERKKRREEMSSIEGCMRDEGEVLRKKEEAERVRNEKKESLYEK
jgi:hypothetical protein